METPETAKETSCFHVWLREDGVLCSKIKQGAVVKLNDAIENTEAISSLIYKEKHPLLVDTRGVKSLSKEARHHFSLRDREKIRLYAIALVVDSLVGRVIGNFFIGINKPMVPTKLFGNVEDAMVWLKKWMR